MLVGNKDIGQKYAIFFPWQLFPQGDPDGPGGGRDAQLDKLRTRRMKERMTHSSAPNSKQDESEGAASKQELHDSSSWLAWKARMPLWALIER